MPLHIDRVDTELDVTPADHTRRRRGAGDMFEGTETELLERLRPLVLQILEEELDRLRRERG